MTSFVDLPADLRLRQFPLYLTGSDLLSYSSISTKYRNIIDNPNLWRYLILVEYQISYSGLWPLAVYFRLRSRIANQSQNLVTTELTLSPLFTTLISQQILLVGLKWTSFWTWIFCQQRIRITIHSVNDRAYVAVNSLGYKLILSLNKGRFLDNIFVNTVVTLLKHLDSDWIRTAERCRRFSQSVETRVLQETPNHLTVLFGERDVLTVYRPI